MGKETRGRPNTAWQYAGEKSEDYPSQRHIRILFHNMVCSSSTRTRERGTSEATHRVCIALIGTCQTMYKGVLRDEERRLEKMRQREAELQESRRKREVYERFQEVRKDE